MRGGSTQAKACADRVFWVLFYEKFMNFMWIDNEFYDIIKGHKNIRITIIKFGRISHIFYW